MAAHRTPGTGLPDERTLVTGPPGEQTPVMPFVGGSVTPTVASDPEMVDLRACADEVVRAAGGIPRRLGYRPRLEPERRPPLELLVTLGSRISAPIREHPVRSVALTLTGLGAVAAALLLTTPRDASLDLAVRLPHPTGLVALPAPPPPPPSLPEDLPSPPPPPPAPIAETRPAPGKRTAHQRPQRGARASAARRTVAAAHEAAPGKEGKELSAPREKLGTLDRASMVAGMKAIQPLVKDCYRHFNQKGVATVRIDVSSSGKVKAVAVTGPLAKTRTAACVKAAVKTARFQGGGATFQYPLRVR